MVSKETKKYIKKHMVISDEEADKIEAEYEEKIRIKKELEEDPRKYRTTMHKMKIEVIDNNFPFMYNLKMFSAVTPAKKYQEIVRRFKANNFKMIRSKESIYDDIIFDCDKNRTVGESKKKLVIVLKSMNNQKLTQFQDDTFFIAFKKK